MGLLPEVPRPSREDRNGTGLLSRGDKVVADTR